MEEDSRQCQSDCDCRRCALVPSTYLAALAYCEYAQQLGAMIGPMGMLLAGMAIAEVPLKKVFCTPRNYLPVALRLIVVPIIVLLLLRVFHASNWIADGKAILMTVYLSLLRRLVRQSPQWRNSTIVMRRTQVHCMF